MSNYVSSTRQVECVNMHWSVKNLSDIFRPTVCWNCNQIHPQLWNNYRQTDAANWHSQYCLLSETENT